MQSLWNLGRAAAVLFAALSLTTGVAQASDAYSHDGSPGAANTDWMAQLDDNKMLFDLSLPGTHDSGAANTGGDLALTQSMDLTTQLNAGIRAWDIRLVNMGTQLDVWHGGAHQGLTFDADVMAKADAFLAAHPSEVIVMRIKEEWKGFGGFSDAVKEVLDKYGDRVYHTDADPQLSLVRGKIFIVRDFEADDYGVDFNDNTMVNLQDTYDLSNNWDLAWKWWKVKSHLDAAKNSGKLVINYLSAAGGFPYFFASGKSSHGTNAPQLLTGYFRGGSNTCAGNWKCLDEFPSVSCTPDICSVEFRGINELAKNDIRGRGKQKLGLIYADFPGRGLIKAVINSNFEPAKVLQGVLSRRCVDVPGATQANGTQVTLWDCNGNANQRFTADADGRLHVYAGKCLELRRGSGIQGTQVQIGDCDRNNQSQLWEVKGAATIRSLKSPSMCLEPGGVGTANGTPLIIWPCNGTVNQRWLTQLDPLPI